MNNAARILPYICWLQGSPVASWSPEVIIKVQPVPRKNVFLYCLWGETSRHPIIPPYGEHFKGLWKDKSCQMSQESLPKQKRSQRRVVASASLKSGFRIILSPESIPTDFGVD